MATVSERVLEEIKARTDLADLVASYGIAVRQAGGSAKACCPFHNEKTPSFNINVSRGFYHCFGCGESGDAIKFVQKMEGLQFMDAVRKLAEPLGIRIEEEKEDPEAGKRKRLFALMAELSAFYRRCLVKMKEAETAREYLKKRDLDERVCDEWQIGYAPNGTEVIVKWAEKYGYTLQELADAGVIKPSDRPGDSGYHRFGGRLMFSIRDRQGRVVAFSGRQLVERKNSGKYVNSPETPIFKKSNVLFGFDKAAANIAKSPHREAIACEGQIDTIRLHECGFPVAVASQGTAFTEEHARMLKRVCDSIVLAYDDDAAGHKATVKVGGMMLALEVPVRVVSIPDGDDPDSFLRRNGAAKFKELIDRSESIVAFQVRSERAKETDPGSIDAVTRVSRAVVATIAKCPSAIIRASLADEASQLLGLPVAALAEEVEKAKAQAPRTDVQWQRVADSPQADDGTGDERSGSEPEDFGADSGESAPPPSREMALMEFLLANEGNGELDAMLGACLPGEVFAHGFTRRFVDAWRVAIATGEDAIGAFAGALAPSDRRWFDQLLLAGERTDSCSLDAADIMQDFVRSLWSDALKRRRGRLPANGGEESERERLQISADLKRLNMIKWNSVREMVSEYIKEGKIWI